MFKSDEFPYYHSMRCDEHRKKSFPMARRAETFTEVNTNTCIEVEGYSSPLFYFYMQKLFF